MPGWFFWVILCIFCLSISISIFYPTFFYLFNMSFSRRNISLSMENKKREKIVSIENRKRKKILGREPSLYFCYSDRSVLKSEEDVLFLLKFDYEIKKNFFGNFPIFKPDFCFSSFFRLKEIPKFLEYLAKNDKDLPLNLSEDDILIFSYSMKKCSKETRLWLKMKYDLAKYKLSKTKKKK